jgi:radical SAM superfamily enzyme YgiQ (UPF0313 family)
MDCDFCSVTAFNGNQYRLRPVSDVLDELELFRGNGRAVFFVDDNIVGHGSKHRERAKELFRGIIERNLKINWFSQASLDVADDEEVLELARPQRLPDAAYRYRIGNRGRVKIGE